LAAPQQPFPKRMQPSSAAVAAAFGQRLREALGHPPTAGQERAIDAMQRLWATHQERAVLVLRGYAGTGKTALLGALVKALKGLRSKAVLLAPTGRAAKVLASHAQADASTIHRRIYRVGEGVDGPGLSLAPNEDAGTLFIVDEASMIGPSGEGDFGGRDLLRDLLEHVFSAPGCRLLLVGDPAQLPPVGSLLSPALDIRGLRALGCAAGGVDLTEVVRQRSESGILDNATALRELLGDSAWLAVPEPDARAEENAPVAMPRLLAAADVVRVDGHDLQDALESAYAEDGDEEVCIICRSNKRAYLYNQQVRARIHGYEEELSPGDRLMVVRNNYHWARQGGRPGLIANGEPIAVRRIHRVEEMHGLRFADITAEWWDGAAPREIEAKVMLDTLAVEAPALPAQRMRELALRVSEGLPSIGRGARARALREDPWLNALQVKYAYAVTAHKAQGGQWSSVFVDQGYLTEEMVDREFVRWLYTAATRATRKLYWLNFHPRFWGE
jgi:exodeoxyribonuclease-5